MQTLRQGALVILVFPRWRSLGPWPLLVPDGENFARMVKGALQVWPTLSKGPQVVSNTFMGKTPYPFLALLVDGSVADPHSIHDITVLTV